MSVGNKLLLLWTVCVMTAARATPLHMYDDTPLENMDLIYQKHQIGGRDSFGALPEQSRELLQRAIFHKMLNSYTSRDLLPAIGSKWLAMERVPADVGTLTLSSHIMKRLTDDTRETIRPAERPQQKWKIKKGKAGSQLICYFKLCAFRSPI